MKHVLALATLFMLIIVPALSAQQPIILTVTQPNFVSSATSEELIQQFEATHTNVDVIVVDIEPSLLLPDASANDQNQYLSEVRDYAQHADVLMITDALVTIPTTEAGIFLNMSPLVATDNQLDERFFHPLFTGVFNWSDGVWALASSVDIHLLLYDTDRFNEMALNYPTPEWQLSDYQQAIQNLLNSTTDDVFRVARPDLLLRGLFDTPFYGNQDKTGLAQLMMDWQNLDGVNVTGDLQSSDYPMILASTSLLSEQENLSASLLPNNYAGIFASGYAISAATNHPQLAYELAVFLSQERQSAFTGLSMESTALEQELEAYSPDVRSIIYQALENTIPLPDMYYGAFISKSLQIPIENPQLTLSNIDLKIETLVQETELQLVLNTPIPEPQGDGIVLSFGMYRDIVNVYPQEWQELVEQFIATESSLEDIVFFLDVGANSPRRNSQQTDCFFYREDFRQFNYNSLLDIGPLIEADFSFDPQDVIGDLSSVQVDEQILGLPITIAPRVLRYDPELIARTGITFRENTWTTGEFDLLLRSLPEYLPDGTEPFFLQQESHGDHTILMLIASYGGLPFDYASEPVAVNFDDPETIKAIRNVLDLARDGLIDYHALTSLTTQYTPIESPIYPLDLNNAGTSILDGLDVSLDSDDGWMLFPQGVQYTPLAFTSGNGHISQQTPYPELCYRWLRTVSQRPDLFLGLPAYESLIDTPIITSQARAYLMEFILASERDNVTFFTSASVWNATVELPWLYQAFDNYVLENKDLDNELAIAEDRIITFRACIRDILPLSTTPTEGEAQSYINEHQQCASNAETLSG